MLLYTNGGKAIRLASIALLTLFAVVPALGQKTTSGGNDAGTIVYTLGKDTTIIQHFEIKGDSIHMQLLTLPRGITVYEGRGAYNADGSLKSMASNSWKPSAAGVLVPDQETKLEAGTDSSTLVVKKGADIRTRRNISKIFVSNEGDVTTFFLFPYMGFYAPKQVGASATGNQLSFVGNRVYTIQRKEKDILKVGSNLMGTLTLYLGKNNKIQKIDGIGSSLNITGTVNRTISYDSLVNTMIRRQLSNGAAGPLTTRDTVSFVSGDLQMSINYWRPSVRGRKIFGEVVPYNRFWRVGANNATEITLNHAITMKDKKLDAGKYTLFAMPAQTGWTLMFNKKTGIWGTDYDSTTDVLRVPIAVEALPSSVEKLTITLNAAPNGGILNISWENTKLTLPFEEAPQYDEALAKRLGADQYGMKKYVMAFLKPGPNRLKDSAARMELQMAHLRNIQKLAAEGKLVIAGPFLDEQQYAGIFIFNVESIEEARQLTATDPAVKAGSLVMELHPWYGSAALMQVVPIHKKLEKKSVAE